MVALVVLADLHSHTHNLLEPTVARATFFYRPQVPMAVLEMVVCILLALKAVLLEAVSRILQVLKVALVKAA